MLDGMASVLSLLLLWAMLAVRYAETNLGGGCTMNVIRLCESERNYRALEHKGALKQVVGAYAIGQRSSEILDTLARARVWSENIGEWVPCPLGFDRSTWTDILDKTVLERLGDRRCLDCGGFFQSTGRMKCFIGSSPVQVDRCPLCGSVTSEAIGCTEGVV